jgi:hypothetical protein
MLAGGPADNEIERGTDSSSRSLSLDNNATQGDHGPMDVNDRGNDHRFGTGAHPDHPAPEHVGLEGLADEPDQHHAVGEAHGLVEHIGADFTHLAENLSHLPPADHYEGLAALDHQFGTHHDEGDGFRGLHESIHHDETHLGVGGEEHHGIAHIADDHHHDDPSDHHHHPDGFGLGH